MEPRYSIEFTRKKEDVQKLKKLIAEVIIHEKKFGKKNRKSKLVYQITLF